MTYWFKFDQYIRGQSWQERMVSSNHLIRAVEGKSIDRPEAKTGWYLNDECHQWFVDHQIDYEVKWDGRWWNIGIKDPNHAMIAKLRWAQA